MLSFDDIFNMFPFMLLQSSGSYSTLFSFFSIFIMLFSRYSPMLSDIFDDFITGISVHFSKTNTIVLSGKIIEDQYEVITKFSNKLRGVIYYVNNHCLTDPRVKRLIELSIKDHHVRFETCSQLGTEYFIDQSIPLQLTYDIYGTIKVTKEHEILEKKTLNIRHITICIWSKKHSIEDVKTFLEQVTTAYEDFIEMNMNNQNLCFLYMKDNEIQEPMFSVNVFKSNKTFNNLVFGCKDSLKKRLDFFLNNKDFYKKLGIPYTLGMLFHGCPGSGKTSTIKAIANYTNRHLVVLPISKITSMTSLRNVILNEKLGDYKVPHHKRLYVFEEIDCNGMEKIISKRQEQEIKLDTEQNILDEKSKQLFVEKMLKDYVSVLPENKEKESDKITLGGLLELIDGINEATGRILIMTTNKDPSTFDDALLRPGRIDVKLEFTRCHKYEVNEIFKLWFDQEIPCDILRNIPDNKFTPAELGELFINYLDSTTTIFSKLTG